MHLRDVTPNVNSLKSYIGLSRRFYREKQNNYVPKKTISMMALVCKYAKYALMHCSLNTMGNCIMYIISSSSKQINSPMSHHGSANEYSVQCTYRKFLFKCIVLYCVSVYKLLSRQFNSILFVMLDACGICIVYDAQIKTFEGIFYINAAYCCNALILFIIQLEMLTQFRNKLTMNHQCFDNKSILEAIHGAIAIDSNSQTN